MARPSPATWTGDVARLPSTTSRISCGWPIWPRRFTTPAALSWNPTTFPKPSAIWFLIRGAVADSRTWTEAPPAHDAGFRVLGLDGVLATADPVSAEQVVFLVERLKQRFEHVVLDCGADVNEVSLAAASASDQRLIVVTDELAARKGALSRKEALKELDVGPVTAKAVQNRTHKHSAESQQELEASIGMNLVGRISNDWQTAQGAMERGKTMRQHAPRSKAVADFASLADALAGAEQETERRKRVFFNFFR